MFVDRTDPSRAPWRFQFTELEVESAQSDMTCPISSPVVMTYRDPARNAVFRCVASSTPQPDPFDGIAKRACELRLGDDPTVVFWADLDDAASGRITANLGAYPGIGHQRTTARVVGTRID